MIPTLLACCCRRFILLLLGFRVGDCMIAPDTIRNANSERAITCSGESSAGSPNAKEDTMMRVFKR